ncbi:PspC domain-containing protein [bacterium]|nr:PspC domain-containing protein [bacterium]
MKKFYRIKEGKIFFGFCVGLGEYFKIDPILFRLLFVAITLAGFGLGILLYIIASLVTPFKPS